jgi:hypothetical protein
MGLAGSAMPGSVKASSISLDFRAYAAEPPRLAGWRGFLAGSARRGELAGIWRR